VISLRGLTQRCPREVCLSDVPKRSHSEVSLRGVPGRCVSVMFPRGLRQRCPREVCLSDIPKRSHSEVSLGGVSQ